MKQITLLQLRNLLKRVKHAEPIGFTTQTVPTTIPENPYKKLIKYSKINGMIGARYQKAVNKRRLKEGKKPNFRQSENWGERIGPGLIKNENKYFLPIQLNNRQEMYFAYLDGKVKKIDIEKIKPYLKISNPKNQGLKNPLIVRRFDLNNVVEITIEKETYLIKK